MNIEREKERMLLELNQIEKECKTLLSRLDSYREDLKKVTTAEEAAVFDSTHDLEEGLEIIRLF